MKLKQGHYNQSYIIIKNKSMVDELISCIEELGIISPPPYGRAHTLMQLRNLLLDLNDIKDAIDDSLDAIDHIDPSTIIDNNDFNIMGLKYHLQQYYQVINSYHNTLDSILDMEEIK